jgi:hypothetical protein
MAVQVNQCEDAPFQMEKTKKKSRVRFQTRERRQLQQSHPQLEEERQRWGEKEG